MPPPLDEMFTAEAPGSAPVREGRPAMTRAARVFLVSALVLVLLATGAVGLFFATQSRLAGQVHRIDGVFSDLEHRPPRASGPAAEALNILLIGTDRRSTEQTTGTDATADSWVPGEQRSDVTMLVHVDADRERVTLVSIPRDAWVAVPGHGENKINAGYSLGGPALAVETVERLTNVHVDHVAVVDWEGFRAIIDTLGGVTVQVPRTVEDPHNDVVWRQGPQQLDGQEALLYVRQRYGLPGGDLDRVRRQQALMRSLALASMKTVRGHQPWSIYRLLDTITENISVDSEWEVGDMRGLMLDLRGLSGHDLQLTTAPVSGFGREGSQSVVYLDITDGAQLWRAVRDDELDEWAAEHQRSLTVGAVP